MLQVGAPLGLFYTLSNRKNHSKVKAIIAKLCPKDQIAQVVAVRAAEAKLYLTDEDTAKFYRNFSFLFLGYKSESYCWEVVVICRKGVITIIGVVFSFDQRAQGMLGLLCILTSIVLHSIQKPFVDGRMNSFELFSLCCSASIFYFGLFTLDAGENGNNRSGASVLTLIITIGYLFVAFVYGLKYFVFYKFTQSHEKSTPDDVLPERKPIEGFSSSRAEIGVEIAALDGPRDEVRKGVYAMDQEALVVQVLTEKELLAGHSPMKVIIPTHPH
jgi:hypothetical protein